MTVRVFISHSAKETEAIDVQQALVAALDTPASRARFSLLMDKYALEVGDAWRARINLWLGACDVAVVLLSPQALESPFVLYELSVLSYRCTASSGAFRILPVYLAGVDEAMLRKSRLDPMQLTEIQALRGTTAQIVDGVLAEITKCIAAPERPIDRLVDTIRDRLAGVPAHVIDRASQKLALDVPWQPDADRLGRFALRLLSVGMDAAAPALVELRQVLGKDPDGMRQLVELVACSWVGFKAVEELPLLTRAPRGRAVALNAEAFDLAHMYKVAASGGKDTWRFVNATNICAEPEAGQSFASVLAKKIGEELRKALKLKASEDLQATLLKFGKHNVVLVAMRWEGVDEVVLEHLQSVHPHVTFFFLTGQTAEDIPIDERLMRLIVPPLQSGEEQRVLDEYESLDMNVMLPLR